MTRRRVAPRVAIDPPKRPAAKPTGSVVRWLLDADPSIRWQVMRDLAGAPAGEVGSKRDPDGRWPLEIRHPGEMPVETDEGENRPSRWNTLRALRVLDWYSAGA